jgi:deoxyhypusine synthase
MAPEVPLGSKVEGEPISGRETTRELIEKAYQAFVGRELATGYQIIRRMIQEDHTIVLTISGAMTPANLATTSIIPLIQAGFVDIITTTGANIYHDLQRVIQGEFYAIDPNFGDRALREEGYTRIYDLVFPEDDLYRTDQFVSELLQQKPFQRRMTTPEFHDLLGSTVGEIERARFGRDPHSSRSLTVQAHLHRVPIFCGAPQDGSIYLNVALLKRRLGERFRFGLDPETDIHEFGAYHYLAKQRWSQKLSIIILGGGVPKNYALQAEPYLSQICGLATEGYDCDVQFCDAHVQDGGLSSCTAGEAHTWGKTSAEYETNSQYVFTDVTAVFPLIVHGLLQEQLAKRPHRLLELRDEALKQLDQAIGIGA